MRTIKFRGKCAKDSRYSGEWVYGACVQCEKSNDVLIIYAINDRNSCSYHVDPDTVGQFTGLYDKNGEEIYEGDILRYPAKDKYEEENFVSFEVFWHDNDCADNHVGWQIDRRHFHGCICGTRDISTFLPRYTKKMVIIGNIHDNPEVLEGGEE